jgi:Flp pilus assembly protein TadD
MEAGRELLAFMLQQNDLVTEAMEQLKILVARPDAADSDVVQLALLLSETGNPKAAVDLLTPRAAGNDPDLLNALGVALSDSGREPEARAQFERVLAADPNDAPALQNLGILALKRGDVSGAEARLTRALALNPKLPLALNTLGVIYAQKSDFEHAVDSWKRAVACDPRQYDALLNIGIVASKSGNTTDARDALERFVRTAPASHYAADIAEARRILAQLR